MEPPHVGCYQLRSPHLELAGARKVCKAVTELVLSHSLFYWTPGVRR